METNHEKYIHCVNVEAQNQYILLCTESYWEGSWDNPCACGATWMMREHMDKGNTDNVAQTTANANNQTYE